jgi:Leucine-rich repeat (LRR) protein
MISSYGCNAKSLVVETRDTRIDEVSGSHKSSLNDQNVATFYAYSPKMRFFPKLLGATFVNLKTVLITKSNLCLVEFRDFKNMRKLEKLYLNDNKIEKIAPCVFRYAEKLEIIDLSGNQIAELSEDVFANLPHLQQLNVNDNLLVHLESGLFRNNLDLKEILIQKNQLEIIETNFMKDKIEVVDLRLNKCINVCYGCIVGLPLRDFQSLTSTRCESQMKIC